MADANLTYSGVTQFFDEKESLSVIPGVHTQGFKRTQQDY